MPTNVDIVNDYYWLKFSKDNITSAITNINEAAGKLDRFLEIVWGLYTTAFALGITFGYITPEWWGRVIMALPVLILPLARFFCVQVQLPIQVSYRYDEPASIERDCYKPAVNKKLVRLRVARVFTIIAMLSISWALLRFKSGDNQYVNGTLNNNNLALSGRAEGNKTLNILVLGGDGKTPLTSHIKTQTTSDENGIFNLSVPDTTISKIERVYVTWDAGKRQRTISSSAIISE